MYEVGDKVRVKEGLVEFKCYGDGYQFNDIMAKFVGKEFEVETVNPLRYTLKGNQWNWTEEMLEPVPTFKPGDRVRCLVNRYFSVKKDGIYTVVSIDKKGYMGLKGIEHDSPAYVQLDFEKVKTVWAVESNFHGITKGKSYDVIKEGMSLGSPFYRIDCDKGVEMNFFTYHFSEEPPKEEPTKIHKDCIDMIARSVNQFAFSLGYSVVFVTHDEDYAKQPFDHRKYLFGIPSNITIKKGDKLFADTRHGRKLVTAVTGSFKLDKAGLDAMDILYGAKGELKMIVARAQKCEEWKEVALDDVPFWGEEYE